MKWGEVTWEVLSELEVTWRVNGGGYLGSFE